MEISLGLMKFNFTAKRKNRVLGLGKVPIGGSVCRTNGSCCQKGTNRRGTIIMSPYAGVLDLGVRGGGVTGGIVIKRNPMCEGKGPHKALKATIIPFYRPLHS